MAEKPKRKPKSKAVKEPVKTSKEIVCRRCEKPFTADNICEHCGAEH